MDPITLGLIASVVTILAFVYMLVFGQRGIVDWWERRKHANDIALPANGRSELQAPSMIASFESQPPVVAPRAGTDAIVAVSRSIPLVPMADGGSLEDAEMNAATEEHIKSIVQEIENRTCVFLLGAGVSIEAGLSSGRELAEMLARKAHWEYHGEPLQRIAQNYATIMGPVKPVIQEHLRRRLKEPGVTSTDAHRVLASLAEKLDMILTTNWDSLLEEAFDRAKTREYHRLYRDAHVPSHQPTKTTIVKLHGHIDDSDSYAVTEDDYEAFRERNPKLVGLLQHCLTTSTLVVVGYSQEDEDFREIYGAMLRNLKPGEEHRHVYVVNPRDNVVSEQYWRDKAGQRFIRMTATAFFMEVHRQVKEIANRAKELEAAHDLFLYPSQKPVIEFCGMPGIGKSSLLTAIRRHYRSWDTTIHMASIDFKDDRFGDWGESGQLTIWGEITRQLGVNAPFKDTQGLRVQLSQKRRVTLFFDAVELANNEALRWIGETFVAHTDRLPYLRVILASRYSRLTNTLELPAFSQRVESRRLTSFQRLADVMKQMSMGFIYDEELAQLVFDLTAGHPGLVQRTIEWLQERRISSHKELDVTALHELGRFLDDRLSIDILKDAGDDVSSLIRELSYYREFSLADIRRIRQQSIFDCRSFVQDRLLPTGFIHSGSWLAYAMDRTARKLLSNIALLRSAEQFRTTNAELSLRSIERAAGMSGYWHRCTAEYIYHQLSASLGRQQEGQDEDVSATMLNQLNDRLQAASDPEKVLDLEQVLESDDELQGLAERVKPGLSQAIMGLIRQRQASLREAQP